MIINILLLVLVTLAEILVATESKTEARRNKKNLDVLTQEKRNKNELSRIIKYLNGVGIESYHEENGDQDRQKTVMLQPKKRKENVIKSKKTGVRIHFINNPEVLDTYVMKLRKNTSSRSDRSNDRSDDDRRYGNDVTDIRRNAMFHVKETSSEDKNNPVLKDNNNNEIENSPHMFPPSIEDQVTPFKTHQLNSEEKRETNIKVGNPYFNDDNNMITKRFIVKSKNGKVKDKTTKETWDVEGKHDWQTKDDNIKSGGNFDDEPWERPRKRETVEIKSQEKPNIDSWDMPDKNKHVKSDERPNNDPWGSPDHVIEDKVRSEEDPNNEPWDERDKDKVYSQEKSKQKQDLQDPPIKKKAKTFESEERTKPYEKKPKDNDWYEYNDAPKPKKNNVHRDDVTKKELKKSGDIPKETLKTNDYKESRTHKDLRNSREVVWKKNKKSDSYEGNSKKDQKWDQPKVKKDWDAPKKTREADTNWDKIGKEWGEYDAGKTSRSWKQKKRNHDDVYQKPSYVARIPEYNKNRGRDRGGTFQGRTPIPIIGKRGIYDDE